jgi:DNA-binding response OmpR family regulator
MACSEGWSPPASSDRIKKGESLKILIIEDEKRLAGIVRQGLEENAFAVDTSYDGEEGLYMAETYPYDAILLDVTLPGKNGLAILRELRSKEIDVPVIMITARGELGDKIKGLNTGADDYIAKPFDFAELLARLKSVMRRAQGNPSPLITIDDLTIDRNSRTVKRAGREVRLTATEYGLLEYLAVNSGRVISRTELAEHVYAMDSDPDSNVIDVYISYLRKKLDSGFERHLIHTMRGAGYVLKAGA